MPITALEEYFPARLAPGPLVPQAHQVLLQLGAAGALMISHVEGRREIEVATLHLHILRGLMVVSTLAIGTRVILRGHSVCITRR